MFTWHVTMAAPTKVNSPSLSLIVEEVDMNL